MTLQPTYQNWVQNEEGFSLFNICQAPTGLCTHWDMGGSCFFSHALFLCISWWEWPHPQRAWWRDEDFSLAGS